MQKEFAVLLSARLRLLWFINDRSIREETPGGDGSKEGNAHLSLRKQKLAILQSLHTSVMLRAQCRLSTVRQCWNKPKFCSLHRGVYIAGAVNSAGAFYSACACFNPVQSCRPGLRPGLLCDVRESLCPSDTFVWFPLVLVLVFLTPLAYTDFVVSLWIQVSRFVTPETFLFNLLVAPPEIKICVFVG